MRHAEGGVVVSQYAVLVRKSDGEVFPQFFDSPIDATLLYGAQRAKDPEFDPMDVVTVGEDEAEIYQLQILRVLGRTFAESPFADYIEILWRLRDWETGVSMALTSPSLEMLRSLLAEAADIREAGAEIDYAENPDAWLSAVVATMRIGEWASAAGLEAPKTQTDLEILVHGLPAEAVADLDEAEMRTLGVMCEIAGGNLTPYPLDVLRARLRGMQDEIDLLEKRWQEGMDLRVRLALQIRRLPVDLGAYAEEVAEAAAQVRPGANVYLTTAYSEGPEAARAAGAKWQKAIRRHMRAIEPPEPREALLAIYAETEAARPWRGDPELATVVDPCVRFAEVAPLVLDSGRDLWQRLEELDGVLTRVLAKRR